jgi:Na+/proline symporter
MVDFLPEGLLGLGLVSILAILMTTVNSLVVVGGTTLFTDIIKPLLKSTNEKSQLLWVRSLTVLFGLCSLGMAFIFTDIVKLFLMGAFVMMPLTPSIVWALFGKNLDSRAAIISMVSGVILTFFLLPTMPQTAFGPGFFISLLILIISHYYQNFQKFKKEK